MKNLQKEITIIIQNSNEQINQYNIRNKNLISLIAKSESMTLIVIEFYWMDNHKKIFYHIKTKTPYGTQPLADSVKWKFCYYSSARIVQCVWEYIFSSSKIKKQATARKQESKKKKKNQKRLIKKREYIRKID